MDRQRQTLELLSMLGDDVTEAVLERLDPEQAARLRALAAGRQAVAPGTREQKKLLNDFERFFEFALRNRIGIHKPDEDEDDTADSEREPKPFRLTGDPLADLQSLSEYQLAQALETEQPRTAAILLSKLTSRMAADALSLMTEEHRQKVVRELSREQHAPPVLVERIARATLQRGQSLSPEPPDRRDHSDRLADLLRSVPKNLRSGMLTAIEEEEPDLNALLMKKMYRFDDIVALDARVVQQILGEIDGTTLTSALFNAPPEIAEAILGNLSRRARQAIEEEMQFQTHVPDARVQQAREAIAEVIARVDREAE